MKDYEVTVDLGVKEKHIVIACFQAKIPVLAELAAKDKYGNNIKIIKVKEMRAKHKPVTASRKAQKPPAPEPASAVNIRRRNWRPMQEIVDAERRESEEKTFRL